MASISQLLNTARDALTAQSHGLSVTGQNLANVNTPGYVRREALLGTRALGGQSTGSVQALGVRRATDMFLERRQYEAQGQMSAASEHDQRLASVEALFNDQAGSGIGSSLDAVFNSFSALAANPADTTVRQSVLEAAGGFAQRVRDTADSLAQSRAELLSDAQTTAQQINETGEAIARLNAQISAAEASGDDAADLKDQRNKLMLDLASVVDVRAIASSSGMVIQSSGTTLVEGSHARKLSVDLDGQGAIRVMASQGDGAGTDVTRFLTGGKLAGIRETRDVDLLEVQKKFDAFVFDVASTINQQHRLGVGTDRGTARNVFEVTTIADGAARSLQVSADVFNNPKAVAASGSVDTLPGGSDNAALLSALRDSAFVFGTSTAAQAYGEIVGDVASRRSASEQMLESRQAIAAQVDAMHEAMSGVSLDEEFVNLTKFQRAYEASARVLTTADQLLQDLIDHVGR